MLPLIVCASVLAGLPSPLVRIETVPFPQVRIEDRFWQPLREVNRTVTLPHSLDMLARDGDLGNFDLAAQGKHDGFKGFVFVDSDVYKVLESVAYSLATHPDPALDARLDGVIAKLAAAQQPDGYLNTWYTVKEPGKRFTNLEDNHELYCAGHLIEAAVAHYQATGKKNLLSIATRYADLLAKTFGDGPGQRAGYCGHPEIELALVKLARVTGQSKYFDLAHFFIRHRGEHFFAKEHNTPEAEYDGAYWQDDVPITEHDRIKGHAVRAAYLMSGATDIGVETQDAKLLAMVDRVWTNCTTRNTYVTGGIGPSASNEGFTTDYDLPNASAYQETCASVAVAMWNHRLALAYGDAKYADVMETALYNGALAGVSMDGERFFYVNPLESNGGHHRSPWFACACCPPNISRTLSALGDYAYGRTKDGLWANLYIQGGITTRLGNDAVELGVKTDYPWDGAVSYSVKTTPRRAWTLHLRVPGWCQGATAAVNGKAVASNLEHGYITIRRSWKAGDRVALNLPMPVRRVAAHPLVEADRGQLAIARGPLVYCLEAVDNPTPLNQFSIPAEAVIKPKPDPMFHGIIKLEGQGLTGGINWPGGLYATASTPHPVTFTAIPYYAWDNRKAGPMRVWMPVAVPTPVVRGLEASAKIALSNTSNICVPEAIRDGKEPKRSSEHPGQLCHWWPRKGTDDDWVSYTWAKAITVSRTRLYWFDDTGVGECRPPQSYVVEYWTGSQWMPLPTKDYAWSTALDHWIDVSFTPTKTTALRIRMKMQPNYSVGIHEWQVFSP